jgi:hypothetical protein
MEGTPMIISFSRLVAVYNLNRWESSGICEFPLPLEELVQRLDGGE